MKANIDENGTLTVVAETFVESFALKVWFEDFNKSDPRKYAIRILTLEGVNEHE